jgi:5'-nucleotidase/UDP-sugar diphosphatase
MMKSWMRLMLALLIAPALMIGAVGCEDSNENGSSGRVARVKLDAGEAATFGVTKGDYAGMEVTIPAGAVTADVTIEVYETEPLSDDGVVGVAVEMLPAGTTFNVPITITLPFNPAQVPVDQEYLLVIKKFDGTITSIKPTSIDRANGLVTFQTSSFSIFYAALTSVDYTLTVLHNNDGESDITADSNGNGGAAQFVTLVNQLKAQAASMGSYIMLSSGDNFLAGTAFQASLDSGTFYDAILLNKIGYDAICLGNHDFDFGPQTLVDFIDQVTGDVPYLSANLDFINNNPLDGLEDDRIFPSTVVTAGGRKIGVIGATTEELQTISTPGDVTISDAVNAINAEVTALQNQGVNIIIVISHLQSVNFDINNVAPNLSGVDLIIAGGGDELLANVGQSGVSDNDLLPGDNADIPMYPTYATDADGNNLPIVTTPGNYTYLGRIVMHFDESDNLLLVDKSDDPVVPSRGSISGPVPVTADLYDDQNIVVDVVEPVEDFEESLGETVIATYDEDINWFRGRGPVAGVRTAEVNGGNLVADALWYIANRDKGDFGVGDVDFAIQNGGGIRLDDILAVPPYEDGEMTRLDTFRNLPFTNFVSVIEGVEPDRLKEIFENAYSQVENISGRFAQVSGHVYVEVDLNQTAQVIDTTTGLTTTPGARIRNLWVDTSGVAPLDADPKGSGVQVVANGQLNQNLPAGTTFSIATIDFSARVQVPGTRLGGDSYPWADYGFTRYNVTYQQALEQYVSEAAGLDGEIDGRDYTFNGNERIFLNRTTDGGNPVTIMDIQGDSTTRQTSAYWGQIINGVTGIVTGVDSNGFFMQDAAGDGDDNTSDGIFVYTGSTPTVAEGDEVEVDGLVVEYFGGSNNTYGEGGLSVTQLTNPTRIEVTGSGSITAVTLGDSSADRDLTSINQVGFSTGSPDFTDAVNFWESLEGMLVEIPSGATMVAPMTRFSEWWVSVPNTLSNTAETRFAPSTSSFGGVKVFENPAAGTPYAEYYPELIQIDNGLGGSFPFDAMPGDVLNGPIEGVVTYSFGNFEIYPTDDVTLSSTSGAAKESTTVSSAGDVLTVATWNIYNYDGGSSDAEERAEVMADNLGFPDIIALQEVQDNNGDTDDGTVSADTNLDELVDALNDTTEHPLSPGDYAWIEIAPVDNMDGGAPGANIRVAYLYRTGRVTLGGSVNGQAGTATQEAMVTGTGSNTKLNYNPVRIGTDSEYFEETRKPLVAHFAFNGETIFLVNVHLSSKSGDEPLFGRNQPPNQRSLDARNGQAMVVYDFVADILAADSNANVVVLGDFNDFEFSTTMQIIETGTADSSGTALLDNLLESELSVSERYTYIFNGRSQSLDNICVGTNVVVDAFQVIHCAADFLSDERASDHDPLIVGIELGGPVIASK